MPEDVRPYVGPPRIVTINIDDKAAPKPGPTVVPETLQVEIREFDHEHDWKLVDHLSAAYPRKHVFPIMVTKAVSYCCRGPHLFFLLDRGDDRAETLLSSSEYNLYDPEYGGWMSASLFMIKNFPDHRVSKNMVNWLHHFGVDVDKNVDQFLLKTPKDWWNVRTVKEVDIVSGGA